MFPHTGSAPEWPAFNPGILRCRGTIEENVPIKNLDGGTKNSWTPFINDVAFGFLNQHGREYFALQQLRPELSIEIVMRYQPGITAKMRLTYGSRVFELVAPPINVDERNLWLRLMCRELP